jgi:hypothetical protein
MSPNTYNALDSPETDSGQKQMPKASTQMTQAAAWIQDSSLLPRPVQTPANPVSSVSLSKFHQHPHWFLEGILASFQTGFHAQSLVEKAELHLELGQLWGTVLQTSTYNFVRLTLETTRPPPQDPRVLRGQKLPHVGRGGGPGRCVVKLCLLPS